ncbi:hypothetical protein BC831DRAFT_134882 [Entophlyctis helioformis]|nr:hypothetical protein BC831DRAFT_134882 [Entophlyctis helioformis]
MKSRAFKEVQLILEHGSTKYAMMRCREQLDEWMAHPDTQQWSCKQLVLLFAAVVHRVIVNAGNFRKIFGSLFEEVGNASAPEVKVEVACDNSQSWQEACQSVDDAIISSRLDVPSLDQTVASLTQDQQKQLATALKSASAKMLTDITPKNVGQLPDPAGSLLERIKRRLLQNTSKPGAKGKRRLHTAEESHIQRLLSRCSLGVWLETDTM